MLAMQPVSFTFILRSKPRNFTYFCIFTILFFSYDYFFGGGELLKTTSIHRRRDSLLLSSVLLFLIECSWQPNEFLGIDVQFQ